MENNNLYWFVVPGIIHGKKRPRFRRMGNFVQTYTTKEDTIYENYVRTCFNTKYGEMLFSNVPIKATIKVYYPIPKSASKKMAARMLSKEILPTKKPDVDNIAKSILDSLNNIAYGDDAYVSHLNIVKSYSDVPRVYVILEEDIRKGDDEVYEFETIDRYSEEERRIEEEVRAREEIPFFE